ncbi:hypothetical protein GCM10009560_79240 [Nonomuraea longicatena]|uniref:Uncharacterized protein n=1 Tax=Nonomuraea longicatena TaxID=83682 RepID=A0ABP4BVA1_9ACTN
MAEDYPYALDLELSDTQGRKVGLFHLRAPSAPDFLAELREVDESFGLALGEAVRTVRTFALLRSELGAEPVAQGAPQRPAARPATRPAPRQTAPTYEAQDAPWPDDLPPGEEGPPVCSHGPMRYVPAGTSKAGKPYSAFYGCTADRNDPTRCKSVPA